MLLATSQRPAATQKASHPFHLVIVDLRKDVQTTGCKKKERKKKQREKAKQVEISHSMPQDRCR
jgi:hypothetical protein